MVQAAFSGAWQHSRSGSGARARSSRYRAHNEQIAGGFCDEYRDALEVVIGAKAEGHEPTPVGPVTRDDT